MNRKNSIYLFYAIALLQGLVFYGPIATLYRQAQGVTVFQITVIESISLVLMIALEVLWGQVADRIGYKKTILICNFLYFISKIIFWKANGFAMFLIERLILAVVFSGLSGCDTAYLFSLSDKNNTQKIFGIYDACGTAGLIIASVIFSTLIKDDFSLAGFLTVLSYGISMILTLFLYDLENDKILINKEKESFKSVFNKFIKNRKFLLFLIASALISESNQTITTFLNQIQYVRANIDLKYMGYIYIVVTISGTLTAYTHKITKIIGNNGAIKLFLTIACVSCLILSLSYNPIASVLCIIALRIASSLFYVVSIDIQNSQINSDNRATMLSIYSCIMNITAVSTNLTFGKLSDLNVSYAMLAGAVFCFISYILYKIWHRSDNKNI